MYASNRRPRSWLLAAFAGLPLAACAASEAPPAAPPPAANDSASAAPVAPPAPPAAPPAQVAEEPKAPEPKKPDLNHRHPLIALFLTSVDALEITAQQKATIDGIKADLLSHAEIPKEPREKLEADVVSAVSAGKFEQAKIDDDIRTMVSAVTASQPAIQEDLNHLHRALNPDQRKKLVDLVREKAKEMHAHGMAMHERGPAHEGKAAEHEREHEHEHAGKGPEHDHGGGHERGVQAMGEGPLAKLAEELNLTPEQSAKIRAKVETLAKAQQAAMKTKMAAAQKHLEAVAAAFITDGFDAKKAGIGTQAPELVKTMVTERVQFVQAVLPVLTPEQRGKFAAHIQAHNEAMR